MLIVALLFWLAIAWLFYTNIGYLLLLQVLALLRPRAITRTDSTPAISLIIAAHNEEEVIAKKLENSLALDYPADRLEIIVASDASSDRTDEIVRGFSGRGVTLCSVSGGLGKVQTLNSTVPRAHGDILVFSDADSLYAPDALRKLVRSFADPQVGAITGEERRVATADGKGLGESLYARLDNRVKQLEGALGSMIMVNGGFFAIRRSLYPTLPPHLPHDAVVPCLLRLRGYRTAYEAEARSVETYALDSGSDFQRRLRTVNRAFSGYMSVPAALNPLRTGLFAVQVCSHRFCHWLSLPWLVVALATNTVLAFCRPLYLWTLIAQLLCYLLALAGWLLDRRGIRIKLFYIPFYFFYVHAAAFVAIVQAVTGRSVATWKPTTRGR